MNELFSILWIKMFLSAAVVAIFYFILLVAAKYTKGKTKAYIYLSPSIFLYGCLIFNLGNLGYLLLSDDVNNSGMLASVSMLIAVISIVIFNYIRVKNKIRFREMVAINFVSIYKAVMPVLYVFRVLYKDRSIGFVQALHISIASFKESYFTHLSLQDDDFKLSNVGSLVFIADMFFHIRKTTEIEDEISGICTKEIQKIKAGLDNKPGAKFIYKVGYVDMAIIDEVVSTYKQHFPIIKIV